MNKRIFWSMVVALTMGIALTSCSSSNDDDSSTSQEATQAEKAPSPVETAAEALNQEMAGLDFRELEALAAVVPVTTRGNAGEAATEFESKLKTLLDLLKTDVPTTRRASGTLGHRFSFQAFNDALQLAWDISVILGDQGESSSSWFGLNSTKQGEVNYTARDGSQYTVKGVIDKETWVKFRGFKTEFVVTKSSDFQIFKNGDQVLKILSGSEDNRPAWLPILIKNLFYTGQLYYGGYEVNMTYDKSSTHQRSVVLTYGKADQEAPLLTMSMQLEDDADIQKLLRHDVKVQADFTVEAMDANLIFNGHVNNVNSLIVNGLKTSQYMKEGTTKEECESIVADFNDNLSLTLKLMGYPVGNLYMGVEYHESDSRYYPVIMIHTTILGEEDYVLTTLLQMLGVDLPELLMTAAEIES